MNDNFPNSFITNNNLTLESSSISSSFIVGDAGKLETFSSFPKGGSIAGSLYHCRHKKKN